MSISSIDDLLMGGSTSQNPMSPEEKGQTEPEPIEELEDDSPEAGDYEDHTDDEDDDHTSDPYEADDADDEGQEDHTKDVDEYGNEKPKPRTYTEEEHKELLNQAIRERVAQFKRNNPDADVQQPTQQQINQQTKGFEFDPDSDQSLPQQLEAFIKQTVNNMTSENDQRIAQQKEREIQEKFEEKFRDGMSKFQDFRDVIVSLPFEISNHMTLATRSMDNPAAFLYAAAKRHPQELERIAKMRDPIAQVTEMGRLEERMRKNKPTTKAPRPLGRAKEDAMTKVKPKQKDTTGDDLLAKADAKRLTNVKQRHRSNR